LPIICFVPFIFIFYFICEYLRYYFDTQQGIRATDSCDYISLLLSLE